MADLAATDVTITISNRAKDIVRGAGTKNVSVATIAFGDGALTYPANGVPLPACGNFGLLRNPEFMGLEQPSAAAVSWRYDATNHKLRGYNLTDGSEVSGAVAATSLRALIVGD